MEKGSAAQQRGNSVSSTVNWVSRQIARLFRCGGNKEVNPRRPDITIIHQPMTTEDNETQSIAEDNECSGQALEPTVLKNQIIGSTSRHPIYSHILISKGPQVLYRCTGPSCQSTFLTKRYVIKHADCAQRSH